MLVRIGYGKLYQQPKQNVPFPHDIITLWIHLSGALLILTPPIRKRFSFKALHFFIIFICCDNKYIQLKENS